MRHLAWQEPLPSAAPLDRQPTMAASTSPISRAIVAALIPQVADPFAGFDIERSRRGVAIVGWLDR